MPMTKKTRRHGSVQTLSRHTHWHIDIVKLLKERRARDRRARGPVCVAC